MRKAFLYRRGSVQHLLLDRVFGTSFKEPEEGFFVTEEELRALLNKKIDEICEKLGKPWLAKEIYRKK